MSNFGYIKLNRSREFFELLEHYPHAFLLLTLIASKAKRDDEYSAQGLLKGQCFVNFKSCGLTERQYRTAKDKLEELSFSKFYSTTDKKTVATLLDSRIYNVNLEGVRRTTDGRNDGRNDGQEIILNNPEDTPTNDIIDSKKEFATDETTDETTVYKNCLKKNKEQTNNQKIYLTDEELSLKKNMLLIQELGIELQQTWVYQMSKRYKLPAILFALNTYLNLKDKTIVYDLEGFLVRNCIDYNETNRIMNENTTT